MLELVIKLFSIRSIFKKMKNSNKNKSTVYRRPCRVNVSGENLFKVLYFNKQKMRVNVQYDTGN